MKEYIGGVLVCWAFAIVGTLLLPIMLITECHKTSKYRKIADRLRGVV